MANAEVKKITHRPDPRCEVTVNGEKVTVFMSFALLNTLAGIVGDDIQSYGSAALSGIHREQMILFMLAPKDEKTKRPTITDGMDIFQFEMSVEDSLKLINWAMEHIGDFLLGTAQGVAKMMQERLPQLQELTQTANSLKSLTDGSEA